MKLNCLELPKELGNSMTLLDNTNLFWIQAEFIARYFIYGIIIFLPFLLNFRNFLFVRSTSFFAFTLCAFEQSMGTIKLNPIPSSY